MLTITQLSVAAVYLSKETFFRNSGPVTFGSATAAQTVSIQNPVEVTAADLVTGGFLLKSVCQPG